MEKPHCPKCAGALQLFAFGGNEFYRCSSCEHQLGQRHFERLAKRKAEPKEIRALKREANELKRAGMKHCASLEVVAERHGFLDWNEALAKGGKL